MALSDRDATNAQIEASRRFMKERREALERAAAIEAARTSDPRQWADASGNTWTYVVLGDEDVRIERCEPATPHIDIPEQIEGKPVVALAADACANLPEIESIFCPDSIVDIGYCAFRNDTALRKATLPTFVSDFDSDWFRRCISLEELTLPGGLERIKPNIFDCPSLKELKIGRAANSVEPGAFAKSHLCHIEVSEENPFLTTDGYALYAKQPSVLIALCVPVESYPVQDGCQAIAKKGMSSFAGLREVRLPDTIQVISEYAFANTSIQEFVAPRSLQVIGERAFFNCVELKHVVLNEGLRAIGDNAFTKTDISELRLPASIESIGHPLAANSKLVYSGENPTLTIDDGSSLSIDASGGVYRKAEDGLHLIQLEDADIQDYVVLPGTVRIDERAAANHRELRTLKLPASLRSIGKAAFKGCQNLQDVELPDDLQQIEDEAFLGANIEHLQLPKDLEHIGAMALVMHGAHHGSVAPALRVLTVHPENKRFRVDSSLLLEILPDGSERVVHCMDSEPIVKVPKTVTSIAPYAFNGDRNIRELYLSDKITDIGIRGLAIDRRLDLIHIDMEEPIEGHDHFDISFPATDRGEHQMYLALTVPRSIDVEGLLDHYDNTIVNASNFDSVYDGGLTLYEHATKVLDRLQDPIFMSPVNKSLAERFVALNLPRICVEIAKHDDRRAIDVLCDLGFITGDNLPEVIEQVGTIQDAAMTGYLLELKRVRFDLDVFDFSL